MDKRVIEMVMNQPNDMELGGEIRKMVWDYQKAQSELGYNDAKIYESPDGGKTVYERPFGGDISERKLVTSDETEVE
jgi:hypothetical protein